MWHLFPVRVHDGRRRRVFEFLRTNGVARAGELHPGLLAPVLRGPRLPAGHVPRRRAVLPRGDLAAHVRRSRATPTRIASSTWCTADGHCTVILPTRRRSADRRRDLGQPQRLARPRPRHRAGGGGGRCSRGQDPDLHGRHHHARRRHSRVPGQRRSRAVGRRARCTSSTRRRTRPGSGTSRSSISRASSA